MIVAGVIVSVLAVIMSGMRIECGSRRRRRRRRWNRLLVAVSRVVSAWIYRVIITERDTFEFTRRSSNRLGLPKCYIVRRFAFEDEIGGLIARQRLVPAEPYDERTIDHLDWAVFCRPFYIGVYLTGAGRSYTPFFGAFVVAGYNESPSG